MSNPFILERIGQILIVRFDRPESRNPLSIAVLEGLRSVIDSLGADVSRLIFTGTEDVFASGADLREIAEIDGQSAGELALRGQALMQRIADLPVRTIAAVNGYCFGGALDLALACDVRIASPKAEFCHPGANLGIMTGWGGTQRLPRIVGEAAALEMFITAKRVKTEEALRIGLVNEIAEDPLKAAVTLESGTSPILNMS